MISFALYGRAPMEKCVFLDRDGVINEDNADYIFKVSHFNLLPGVPQALQALREVGYRLIVITNQAGIDKGLYSHADVRLCHAYMQLHVNNLFDGIYYSPYHPSVTASLSRKPGRLLFEKAIAKFRIDPTQSWMVGDRQRDLTPAHELGMRTIQVGYSEEGVRADYRAHDLREAVQHILKHR